ncbi:MAG: SpoIIE family protein phosphatase [Chloroflexi bacterium]|nr:SpoIIE family protein phosphatase [Chloroflexota bacterium]
MGYAFIVDKSGTFIARPGIEAGEEKWDEIFTLDKLLNTNNTELNTVADKIYSGNPGIELSKLTTRTIYLNIASVIDNNVPDFSWNKFLNDDSLQYYEVKIDNNNWLNNGKYTIFMANYVLPDGYHTISVRAVDNAGKITDQANLSFCIKTQSLNQTTPVISNIKISAISQESVTINWLTNNETTSQVSYSKDTSYRNSTSVDTNPVTNHSVSIKGLEAGVTYHYRVKSIDSQGNESISGDNTFQVKYEQKYMAYAPIQATGLSIVIVSPVSEILASAHITAAYIASEQGKLQRIFAGVIAGILIIVVLFTFWLARRLTKPILKIKEETSLIGAGNLDHRINIKTGDEIEDLANSFNKMATDLKAYTAELQRTTAEKERMAKELEIAKGIQQNFLPEFAPIIEGLELAGFNLPAWEVGGDFYDFIPVDTGKWGLVIADVSGKGVPAALFMALSRTLIRAYSIGSPKVSEAILRANEMISEDDRSGMFVTLFYGVLDVEKRTITYVNAGHNSPIMLDTINGGVILLAAKGIAVGVMTGITLEEKTVILKKGDVIALYTDGATEAINRKGEQFGTERLTQLVTEYSGLPAAELIDRIQKKVTEFSEGQPQFDDVTLMILKVN